MRLLPVVVLSLLALWGCAQRSAAAQPPAAPPAEQPTLIGEDFEDLPPELERASDGIAGAPSIVVDAKHDFPGDVARTRAAMVAAMVAAAELSHDDIGKLTFTRHTDSLVLVRDGRFALVGSLIADARATDKPDRANDRFSTVVIQLALHLGGDHWLILRDPAAAVAREDASSAFAGIAPKLANGGLYLHAQQPIAQ